MVYTAYHGTENNFDTFDLEYCGSATGVKSGYLFFTSSKNNAGYYGYILLTCELHIKRPFIVKDGLQGKSPRQWADDVQLKNFFEDTEYDGVILEDVKDGTHYSTIYVVFNPDQITITERLDTSLD
jgi:hypothetical protein